MLIINKIRLNTTQKLNYLSNYLLNMLVFIKNPFTFVFSMTPLLKIVHSWLNIEYSKGFTFTPYKIQHTKNKTHE